MTEENNVGVITLKGNKNNNTPVNNDKNQNQNQNELEPIKISVRNNNQEILDSKEDFIKPSPQTVERLELNENNIYGLSSEIIEKLKVSPCQICQSKNYSIFIPDSFSNEAIQSNQNENVQVQETVDNIKPIYNQNIFFPILICQQNHQTCLICHEFPHINTLCNQKKMDNNNIISILEIIKGNFPEKQKVIESMKEFVLNQNKKEDDNQEKCCTCKCTCSVFFLIFAIFFWTIISFVLFAVGVALLAVACGFRILCCCYHCCYNACCTTKETKDYDKGDHILRVITMDGDKQAANQKEAEADDENLKDCGSQD